jgi:hypothetical protein
MSGPPDNSATDPVGRAVTHHRVGPFITRVAASLSGGRHLVATSRRHRKGLAPQLLGARALESDAVTRARAWRHFWAPDRVALWTAVTFVIGSGLFALGGWAAGWPSETLAALRPTAVVNRIFFVGSLFFTGAAYLQLFEAANGDVAEAFGPRRTGRRFVGWKPRNLGWAAAAVQLVGTLAFNADTGDALIAGLTLEEEELLIWTPNALGCFCFLAASAMAWLELSHGAWSFAPRSASWWSVVANAIGSAAFALSAWFSFVPPGPLASHQLHLADLYTFVGALCFLVGSYLLIPELFDGEERNAAGDVPDDLTVIASA